MNSTKLMKILSSLPSIMIFLYFIPVVGICLIILRYFVYNNKKSIEVLLIGIGILLILPRIIFEVANLLSISHIPYLNDMVGSQIYLKMLNYSKILLIVGIIILIISSIFRKLFSKIFYMISSYLFAKQKIQKEIDEKNDLEIKLKQERAKTTSVVYCPYCGADNILTEKVGECKYCRRKIENKTFSQH